MADTNLLQTLRDHVKRHHHKLTAMTAEHHRTALEEHAKMEALRHPKEEPKP